MPKLIRFELQISKKARLESVGFAGNSVHRGWLLPALDWAIEEELGRKHKVAATERFRKRAFRRLQSASSSGSNRVLVHLVSSQEIWELNWLFRRKNKATDVLSFAAVDSEDLGELAVCPAVIVEQAKRFHVTATEEFHRMLLHGALHLLGLDHERSAIENRAMMDLQESALAWLEMSHELHQFAQLSSSLGKSSSTL